MLKGYNFIILPNERTSRRRYLRTLISKNGGGYGKEIGLVDDSYVKSNYLINHQIFYDEMDYPKKDIEELKLFKLSSLSRWIKHGYLDFSQPLTLHEEIVIDSESSDSEENDEKDSNKTRAEVYETRLQSQSSSTRDSIEEIKLEEAEVSNQNPNEKLINVLKKLANRYKLQNDTFRHLGYMKMLHRLENINVRIETEEDGIKNGLSKGFSRKIPLLLKLTGETEFNMNPEEQTLLYFQECFGIGGKKSKLFVDKGYRKYEDILPELNWVQMTGLAFFQDWQSRIPRAELVEHEAFVRRSLKDVNNEMEMELMGSFRRGKSSSGDIDILLYKEGEDDMNYLSYQLEKLILNLVEKGYIICPLNLNSNLKRVFQPWFQTLFSHFHKPIALNTSDEPLHKFYCGAALCPRDSQDEKKIIRLEKQDEKYTINIKFRCRRVDFLICSWENIGATKLYFTGSDEFNKKCRLVAKQMGYQLNNDGLYKKGQLIESRDEYKILEILGMGPILPQERNL